MGALVVSHWFLDLPMHRPDLPLWPGVSSPKVGWGLWASVAATYVIEFAIFAAGISTYVRATRARDRIGRWGLWVYILVLAILYVMSNGSPPPSERPLAWTALGIWLFVPWAWWVDKHREYVGRIRFPSSDRQPSDSWTDAASLGSGSRPSRCSTRSAARRCPHRQQVFLP